MRVTDPQERRALAERYRGRVMATLFYEPSTRTRLSFESAAQRLGLSLISTENAGSSSSAVKGESIEDSTRVVSAYADLIVMRHPETGALQKAAKASLVPLINAGDGQGDHPSQALLDVYTMYREFGKVEGLKIAVAGDLLHSRTMHSLLDFARLYKNEVLLISPKQLRLSEADRQRLVAAGLKISEADNLAAVDQTIDVLYTNRIQGERFASPEEYERLKYYFVLTPKIMNQLKPEARILDPLPRVGEIDTAVDKDPRAAYFRQAENGLYIRMALIDELLR
jgi:aspartate carbamoyltransferase catalytic subunit